jgi:hypothetical protein
MSTELQVEDSLERIVDEDEARQTLRYAFCIAYAILFIVGIIGNGYVVVFSVSIKYKISE